MSIAAHVRRWQTNMGIPNQPPLEINPYAYVANNPLRWIDPSGLSSLVFDRGTGTLTVIGSDGSQLAKYPAGNNTTNPTGDPLKVGSNGPAPSGTFPVQSPINTQGQPEYGPYFIPIGDVGPNGERLDIVRKRGIGIHGGRRGPQSRTQGCIRLHDKDVRDLVGIDAEDPITEITIQ